MAGIIQYTVNAIGNPESVIAQTVCNVIEIGEDPSVMNWPTLDYRVRKTDPANPTRQKKAGTTYRFTKPKPQCFQPGDIAGYVETVSSSTTFFQDEFMEND